MFISNLFQIKFNRSNKFILYSSINILDKLRFLGCFKHLMCFLKKKIEVTNLKNPSMLIWVSVAVELLTLFKLILSLQSIRWIFIRWNIFNQILFLKIFWHFKQLNENWVKFVRLCAVKITELWNNLKLRCHQCFYCKYCLPLMLVKR